MLARRNLAVLGRLQRSRLRSTKPDAELGPLTPEQEKEFHERFLQASAHLDVSRRLVQVVDTQASRDFRALLAERSSDKRSAQIKTEDVRALMQAPKSSLSPELAAIRDQLDAHYALPKET